MPRTAILEFFSSEHFHQEVYRQTWLPISGNWLPREQVLFLSPIYLLNIQLEIIFLVVQFPFYCVKPISVIK